MSEAKIVLVNRCFILNNDNRILSVKRANGDRKDAGQWEVPGGKVETGQLLNEGLDKEILEETGLVVQIISPLVHPEQRISKFEEYCGLLYLALYHVGKVVKGEVKLSKEHDDYSWDTYEAFLNRENLRDGVAIAAKKMEEWILP